MGKSNAFPQEGLVEAEDEPNGSYETNGSCDMIPSELHVKGHHAKKDEYAERNDFLNHLELHEREGPTVFCKTYSVGRHLQAVFEKRNRPTESNHSNHRPLVKPLKLGQLKMAIPSKCHEDIAAYQKKYCI